MKIAVISPNPQHLAQVTGILQAAGHQPVSHEGGKSRMRDVAERERPDMMLVDGICCDPAELQLVEQVTMQFPQIAVVLLCSTHTPEFLIQSMRAGVREVLPSPAPAAAIGAAVRRVAGKLAAPAPRESGKVIAFMPCKGGSGATFLATNLAWELAQTKSVLLVDLNLQFGDALSFVHDGRPSSTVADVARDISRLDGSLLAASTIKITPQYSVLAAPEDVAHSLEVKPEHVDTILSVAAAHYDFVIADLARSLDPVTVKALDRASSVFAVLQASLPDLRNASRLLDAFKSLGYPQDKVELVLNRFDRRAEIAIEHVQRTLGPARIHTISNSWRDVISSINHGDPIGQAERNNPVSRQLAQLAQTFAPRATEPRPALARLFRRA